MSSAEPEAQYLTTKEVGKLVGLEEWAVRRLFVQGDLPAVCKFGNKRLVPIRMIPRVIDAARARGWLPPADPAELAAVADPAETLPA